MAELSNLNFRAAVVVSRSLRPPTLLHSSTCSRPGSITNDGPGEEGQGKETAEVLAATE